MLAMHYICHYRPVYVGSFFLYTIYNMMGKADGERVKTDDE